MKTQLSGIQRNLMWVGSIFGTGALIAACFTTATCFTSCGGSDTTHHDTTPPPPADSAAYFGFRNSVTPPPPGWTGPVFQLSHDYPQALPPGGDQMPWLKVNVSFDRPAPDFNTSGWKEYMQILKEAAMKGQDANLANEIGWRTQVDGKTAWWHVPWMAYDPSSGREFIHGCTNERIASLSDLDGDGDLERIPGLGQLNDDKGNLIPKFFETWAVGMYNDYAAYAIGQVFPPSGVPQTEVRDGRTLAKGLPFPVGSFVVKTLFTTATPAEAPFLANSAKWTVDRQIYQGDSLFICQRAPQDVYLIQMDVAVVDPRSPTNWVFGTFVYNGTSNGATFWDRLEPLGIQFGMDDETFPAVPKDQSKPVYQSVLNTNINIFEHFGCTPLTTVSKKDVSQTRLDGPVDNKIASCMSCHGGSFTAPMDQLDVMGTNMPPVFGFTGLCEVSDEENIHYFTTRKYPEPYSEKYAADIPLDFSLQLWVGISQYKQYKIKGAPVPCAPVNPSK